MGDLTTERNKRPLSGLCTEWSFLCQYFAAFTQLLSVYTQPLTRAEDTRDIVATFIVQHRKPRSKTIQKQN